MLPMTTATREHLQQLSLIILISDWTGLVIVAPVVKTTCKFHPRQAALANSFGGIPAQLKSQSFESEAKPDNKNQELCSYMSL